MSAISRIYRPLMLYEQSFMSCYARSSCNVMSGRVMTCHVSSYIKCMSNEVLEAGSSKTYQKSHKPNNTLKDYQVIQSCQNVQKLTRILLLIFGTTMLACNAVPLLAMTISEVAAPPSLTRPNSL